MSQLGCVLTLVIPHSAACVSLIHLCYLSAVGLVPTGASHHYSPLSGSSTELVITLIQSNTMSLSKWDSNRPTTLDCNPSQLALLLSKFTA